MKSNNSKSLKQITAIIKTYNKDPKREGDQIEILIMKKTKSITLATIYNEMIKRFDENDKRWKLQLEINDKILKRLDENDKHWEENNKRWEQLFKKNPSLKK